MVCVGGGWVWRGLVGVSARCVSGLVPWGGGGGGGGGGVALLVVGGGGGGCCT